MPAVGFGQLCDRPRCYAGSGAPGALPLLPLLSLTSPGPTVSLPPARPALLPSPPPPPRCVLQAQALVRPEDDYVDAMGTRPGDSRPVAKLKKDLLRIEARLPPDAVSEAFTRCA